MTVAELDTRAAATAAPDGRQWRFMSCQRAPAPQRGTILADFADARSRRLTVNLTQPATAECVLDGRSGPAAALSELAQDLVVYRWVGSSYRCLFRGPIGRTQDTVGPTGHTVLVDAADYKALLARSPVADGVLTYSQYDQGAIVQAAVTHGNNPAQNTNATLGVNWGAIYNPDGSFLNFNLTGVVRDRTYTGAEPAATVIDDLAKAINGFDWECSPLDPLPAVAGTGAAQVHVWYPQRGVTRPFVADYGSNVISVTRQFQSPDFANAVRLYGKTVVTANGPMYSNAYGDAITNPQLHPEGTWYATPSNADVSVQSTLDEQAAGYLAEHSAVTPSYTVTLAPGAWNGPADFWLGDTIELRVVSGRLNVDTTLRVLGFAFDVNDDGTEHIALTVGRDPLTVRTQAADLRDLLGALTRK